MDANWGLVFFGICGTIIAAILKFAPAKNNIKWVTKDHCGPTHEAIDKHIEGIHNKMGKIFDKLEAQGETTARIEGILNNKKN